MLRYSVQQINCSIFEECTDTELRRGNVNNTSIAFHRQGSQELSERVTCWIVHVSTKSKHDTRTVRQALEATVGEIDDGNCFQRLRREHHSCACPTRTCSMENQANSKLKS
eukprot:INCI7693.5.p2 GENE.INCI7693.5~~INCI7693.5.p2  ORF type:complete len:111 (-),score=17.01 INCI7693.5:46-378(-)